jgi:4-hydroxythreonine-4-phosphate dehydrogenase
MSDKPTVAITMGDPAGIGSEVIVKAFRAAREYMDVIVLGDTTVMKDAVRVADRNRSIRRVGSIEEALTVEEGIPILDFNNVSDLEYGVVREDYGRASLDYVERAIELALDEAIDAIVTAPINKQATRLAGSEHAGHTGLLATRTDTENYSMMLIEKPLRVTHVSTHVSLRKACDLVTTESVHSTIDVTHAALCDLGIDDPTIAVAGLNPHASDGGLLGHENGEKITPAIERAREEEIDARGPESPDTVYVRAAAGEFDCVVSMYHDQGHIPIKMLGFQAGDRFGGVNVTVGLPIVRTSVDHGTAFDIAGRGVASETSMVDAVRIAAQLARSHEE